MPIQSFSFLPPTVYCEEDYNDHRLVKTIDISTVFTAKRQVWQPMIQTIIGAMRIAMNIWRSGFAAAPSSKAAHGMSRGISLSDIHYIPAWEKFKRLNGN